MDKNAALVIIDVQVDFCPGGALPVPGGNLVVEPLNRIARSFAAAALPVFASRDWHPRITGHFMEHGGAWPVHCVQNSAGAAFHPDLHLPEGTMVVSKGSSPDSDSYSAFDGVDMQGIKFGNLLTARSVSRLYVGGLAIDYCVKSTVLDALKAGFAVTVLADAIAGVDIAAGDSLRALEEMKNAGAVICMTDEVLEVIRP